MAERFQPYHVPQQSRRDKLRVTSQIQLENVQEGSNLVPIYDPSIISSDLINCGKEKGINLMGSSSSSSSPTNHLYLDPQSSVQINPSSVEDINGGQYIYNTVPSQCLRVIDQSFPLSTSAATCQGLSLSLSSHHTHQNNLPLELNLQQGYDSSLFSSFATAEGGASGGGSGGGGGGGPSCNELSRSSVPLGPFTGYASILKGSRFLKPAQQLLEEICYVGRGIYEETISSESLDLPPLESFNGEDDDPLSNCSDGGEQSGKKSRLLSMLHEVYRRYKHYYQQMQSVVASFESVAGLSHAAPFANLALKAMLKHFRCLRNVITDQLQCIKSNGPLSCERDVVQFGNSGGGSQSQRPFHNTGFVDQPVWRPQRGLPERAVNVLRAWLFEHFLHPYPTDTDKIRLAKQTGLTRNQVSNWFINARVRLWKPMVEEIHMLETRQAQKSSQQEEHSSNRPNDSLPTSRPVESENPSTSMQRIENLPSTEAPLVPYENLSRQLGMGMSRGGPGGGVSLTLGLHQNVGFSEAYPVNAARRFGLDVQGEGYVSSGFGGQNRQFGRDIIGGQLLHDFVG